MKTKEEIYNTIKTNITKSIDGDWVEAVLEVKVAKNFSSFSGFYYLGGVKKNIRVSLFDSSLDLDLIELHLTTTNDGTTHNWNRATFKLTRDDKLSAEFIWDQELYKKVYGNKA